MYKVAFEKNAGKEFLKLDKDARKLIAAKIIDLKNGNFSKDKQLKGKYKNTFRKRAGNYRIVYLKENDVLLITVTPVAHRKEAY